MFSTLRSGGVHMQWSLKYTPAVMAVRLSPIRVHWPPMQWLRQQNQAAIVQARRKHAKTCSNDAGYDLITVPKVRYMLSHQPYDAVVST